mmetsp:Transcript_37445/g.68499  ORF Transcript_37445/g.68499 Transcript_37445/m.68499 type:complete len:510 (+) Transcript_37445:137-1666(+)
MPETEDKTDGQDEASMVFVGSIKSYNERRGFGFITCEEITRRFGRDAYLAKEEAQAVAKEPLPGQTLAHGEEPPLSTIREGDLVQFQIQRSTEGFPQAVNTRRAPASGSAAATQPAGTEAGTMLLQPKSEKDTLFATMGMVGGPAVASAVDQAQASQAVAVSADGLPPIRPPIVVAPGGPSLSTGLSQEATRPPEPRHVLSSLRPSSAAAPAFTPGASAFTATVPAPAPPVPVGPPAPFGVGLPPPPSWRASSGSIIPAPAAPELLPFDETEAGTRSLQIQWPTVVHATAYTVELFEEGTPQPEVFKRSVPDSVAELVVELRVGNLGVRAYACRVRCLAPCGCESAPSDWSFLPPSWFYPPPSDPQGWAAQIFPELVSQNVGNTDYSSLLGLPLSMHSSALPPPAAPAPAPSSVPLLSTNPAGPPAAAPAAAAPPLPAAPLQPTVAPAVAAPTHAPPNAGTPPPPPQAGPQALATTVPGAAPLTGTLAPAPVPKAPSSATQAEEALILD